jgi:immunity protein 35 of polymorphic toxin system
VSITRQDAEVIAEQHLRGLQARISQPLQITTVLEKPFGWVFCYQSREYVETRNLSSMLAGNSPFIVDRDDGTLHVLGTAYPLETYLGEYERSRGR